MNDRQKEERTDTKHEKEKVYGSSSTQYLAAVNSISDKVGNSRHLFVIENECVTYGEDEILTKRRKKLKR